MNDSLSVGPRYIFFNSIASQTISIYKNAYAQAMGYVGQASSMFRQSDNYEEAETSLSVFNKYVKMIQDLAQNERANEVEFVRNFEKILNEDKSGNLPRAFKEYAAGVSSGNVKYNELIGAINLMMRNMNELEKRRDEIAKNNLELITKNFEKAEQENAAALKEMLDAQAKSNYGKFIAMAKNIALKNVVNDRNETLLKYQTQLTKTLSDKFNSILHNITTNKTIQESIADCWKSNWSAEEMRARTVGVVAKYLLNLNLQSLEYMSGEEMAEQISQNFAEMAEKIEEEQTENLVNLLVGKTIKNLELVALTSRSGIGKMFKEFDKEEQRNIIDTYGGSALTYTNRLFEADISSLGESELKKLYANVTKELGAAIRKSAKEEKIFQGVNFDKMRKENYSALKQLVERAMKEDTDKKFFKTRKLDKNLLVNCLKVKIDGPSMAEFLVSEQFRSALKDKSIFVPGRKILLKTDASVTFSYEPLEIDIPDKAESTQRLEKAMKDWYKNFLSSYKEGSNNTTDIKAADEAFRQTGAEIRRQVEEMIKGLENEDEMRKKILEQLNNYVNASISVKEYTYANNMTAFVGGSLGPNAGKIVDNISNMYLLGGITDIDANLLYFAVMNCSEDTLAHGLKEDIETFLLGGAAMMMFDDGFAATKNYIETVENDLSIGFMPKVLHLYAVQGKYIPASFVYTSIAQALSKATDDISMQVYNTLQGRTAGQVEIINPINEAEDKPNWSDGMSSDIETRVTTAPYAKPQARFNKVAADAPGKVDVRFLFLAGLLDIFEAIPQAFAL